MRLWFGILLAILPVTGRAEGNPRFHDRIDLGPLESPALKEASGLAASRENPGVLWTHNDSGDEARVFALDLHGRHRGVFRLDGATNRDWEDIAVGPGPKEGRSYLYIAEIGDNNAVHELKYVYRVPEPPVAPDGPPDDTTLSGVERLSLRYPHGRRDAETLMVDPLTRDLYVVSKRDRAVLVYCAPYPQATDSIIVLTQVATLPLTQVVAGDISPSGREILLKDYKRVYHWHRAAGQTIADAIAAPPDTLPYVAEPQGEAIAWAADEQAYFTTSEQGSDGAARLFAYRRKPTAAPQ